MERDPVIIGEMTRKLFVADASSIKAVNESTRTVNHSITAKVVDRDGDVVMPKGGRIGDYMKNPVVFFNHRSYSDPPIGRCLGMEANDVEVVAATQFAGLEQNSQQAETVFRLIRDGFMKAWSMGFMIDTVSQDRVFPGQRGRTIQEWTLLEYSAVGIPSNPEALTRMCKGFGLPDGATDKDLFEAITGPQRRWWDLAKGLALEVNPAKEPQKETTVKTLKEQGADILTGAITGLTDLMGKALAVKDEELAPVLARQIKDLVETMAPALEPLDMKEWSKTVADQILAALKEIKPPEVAKEEKKPEEKQPEVKSEAKVEDKFDADAFLRGLQAELLENKEKAAA